MAVVKKEKSSRFGSRSSSSGGTSRETSPYRPVHVDKKPPCMAACPSGTKIREILRTIAETEDRGKTYEESYRDAFHILSEKNPLPATCGRVCPHPCEGDCNRQHKEGSVGINSVERFLGDYAIENNLPFNMLSEPKYDEKIAIIGSGPAGLSCAYQMKRRGYKNVTIFEAFSKPGGMLRYGIPDYRLPQDRLDSEIDRILALGVEIKYNTVIGKDIAYDKLMEDYDAVFVGIGAHKGKLLGMANEDSPNVVSGAQFLNIVNSGREFNVGKKVLVVGGGDTAIDAARISKRLGADVTIVYRRTRNEMPAIKEEIEGAEEEGITIDLLVAPKELIKEGDKVTKMVCQKMELGEPDDSGRRRPVPIDEFVTYEADTIIAAISQEPDFTGFENLRVGRDWVKVDNQFRTNADNTFAGGDVIDLGLVTIAIYQGRKAAETMDCQFRGTQPEEEPDYPLVTKDQMVLSYYVEKIRNEQAHLSPEERLLALDKEISSTYTAEQLIEEAKRCMSCGSCFDCGTCWSLCQDQAIHKPVQKFQTYTFKLDVCKGCNKCAESCPCGYIEMKHPFTGEIAKINRVQ